MTKEIINGVRYRVLKELPVTHSRIVERLTNNWSGRKLITLNQYLGKEPIDWDVQKQEKERILSLRFKPKDLHRNNE